MTGTEHETTAENISDTGQVGIETMGAGEASGVPTHGQLPYERAPAPERDAYPREMEDQYNVSDESGERSRSSQDTEADFEQAFQAVISEHVEGAVQHRLLTHNLMHAQSHYGQEFEAAYKAVVEHGSPALVQQVLSQDNPGETMVHWFRRARMLADIPDRDLDAWVRQRHAELNAGGTTAHAAPPPSLQGARGSGQAFSESIPENAFSYAFGK